MSDVVSHVRQLDSLEEWVAFVRCRSFWSDKPDVIRELERKWRQLIVGRLEDPVESGDPEFWAAVDELNDREPISLGNSTNLTICETCSDQLLFRR